jgi:cyclopropane fatty-acyl-phospholipid synthase-like methyltransferase
VNASQIKDPGASSTAIQHHYDVSNEFYPSVEKLTREEWKSCNLDLVAK